ncbi:hypothetical protein [Pseudomonas amygdali]|uniref:Uncharacterized protein n=2 Tax=Pseudomonas amygdali pv. lachrymans TaxID=53707 RepID=A0ABR5KQH5_PSEAV|nr:hypothetical protein [Pseudomonas amygdali]AXH59630.1 hypothetical protein PLA107_030875 [Pseudomonas amygdali pv. lachrymans str. M301315]KPC17060.1 Uncharacterized protein AC499_0262 [Pseudomonas amygdali pv. lachrymans]KPC18019.1 Uncharacterized protein AC499_1221 [Pseudomonas amygdali pv. lachrymans]RMT06406.1 hypothetical protein ALP54_03548 [Pseudomonas amygdali pv. lachrymans]
MAQRAAEDIEDIEVVAHLFALARSERYRQLKPMFEQALLDYPQISRERMLSCCDQLGTRLVDSDYQGMNSEFTRKLTKKQLAEKKQLRQELLEPGL